MLLGSRGLFRRGIYWEIAEHLSFCCDNRMILIARRLGVLLLICFVAATVTSVAESRAIKGYTDGSFLGIEQGDYAHFQIKPTTKGQPDSFIVLRPDKSVKPFLDNPASLKGRKVRVHWKEETIPEAGGPVKVVVKVE